MRMSGSDEAVVIRAQYETTAGALEMRLEEFAFNPNDPTAGCNLRVAFKSIKDKALKKIEIERRMRLLQQDSELAKLFKQFVIGGILTEAEFWATRKKLLDGDNNRSSKQRMGLKSAMTSVIKPVADGRTNKVTYNVTPEIIHQVMWLI